MNQKTINIDFAKKLVAAVTVALAFFSAVPVLAQSSFTSYAQCFSALDGTNGIDDAKATCCKDFPNQAPECVSPEQQATTQYNSCVSVARSNGFTDPRQVYDICCQSNQKQYVSACQGTPPGAGAGYVNQQYSTCTSNPPVSVQPDKVAEYCCTNYPTADACKTNNPGGTGNPDPTVLFTQCMSRSSGTLATCCPGLNNKVPACTAYFQTNPGANPGTNPGGGAAAGTGVTCEAGYTFKNGLCIPNSTTGGLSATESLGDLLVKIINMLLTLGGIIAVLFIVVGGYWYITAAGNAEQAEKGRAALTNAIIGVVLILMSYAIVNVVSKAITNSV